MSLNLKTKIDSKKLTIAMSFILFCIFPAIMIFSTRIAPVFLGIVGIMSLFGLYADDRLKSTWEALFQRPTLQFNISNLLRISLWAALIWLIVSSIRTDNISSTLRHASGAVLLSILGYFILAQLKTIDGTRHFKFAMFGFIIAVILHVIDILFKLNLRSIIHASGIYELNRSILLCTFLLWPILYAIPKTNLINWLFCIVLWVTVGLICLVGESQSALVAFFISSTIVIPMIFIRSTPIILGCLSGLCVLITPILMSLIPNLTNLMPDSILTRGSAEHRLIIWDYFNKSIFNNFIFGHGMDSAKIIGYSDGLFKISSKAGYPYHASHPHNVALEIWVDFGFIGALIAAFVLTLYFIKLNAYPKSNRNSLCLFLVAILSASSFAYGLFETWWYSTMIIVFIFALISNRATHVNT